MEKCYYCGTEPQDPKWIPYCSKQCAVWADLEGEGVDEAWADLEGEGVDEAYEKPTPEHLFVPVKKQTGCKRCGYAHGHHPTVEQLKKQGAFGKLGKLNEDTEQCPQCDGEGVWCGKHSTTDGCDCEDIDRNIPCDECHGTGVIEADDLDEAMAPQSRGSVVTGLSNYTKWTKQAVKAKAIKEGEPTGSEDSLQGFTEDNFGDATGMKVDDPRRIALVQKARDTLIPKPVKEAGVAPVYECFDGHGRRYLSRVPPRLTKEDTGVITESAGAPTLKQFWDDLLAAHPGLPVRYNKTKTTLKAESQDKASLHSIDLFAKAAGLGATKMDKSVYDDWDSTWVLTITGFKG